MALSKEQAQEIKKQLLLQTEKLPEENRIQIKEYIKNLNEKQLEEFLKQNQIQISQPSSKEQPLSSQCVFCSIVKNQVSSFKIAENKKAIAILEINPLSKAHSIILPLEHTTIEKLPKPAMSLAQKLTKKIKKKFKPNDIKIETSSFMGHAMINIIPIYKEVPLKKQKADENELKSIQQKLRTKSRAKRTSKSVKIRQDSKLHQLPFRIP